MTNLAIIGAGIGGCSAAYFANKYLPGIKVSIYESTDRIGGRILTYNSAEATLELGATFFNSFNKTILGIVKAERLKITPVVDQKDFAIWNGSELFFRSSKQSFATILRLLAKYQLGLARTFLLLRKARGKVAKLYQEELKNPTEIGELYELAGLSKWHKKPFFEYLIEAGVSQALIDEVVTPITRVIYSQNADLGGFAGLSSLIGVYSGATYSLAEGNSSLPIHIAKASNATVKLGRNIDKIEKISKGTYQICTRDEKAVFDGVIIAAPLELADIELDGLSLNDLQPQQYQSVYKQVKRGVFDQDYFGLKKSADPPAIILTTKDADPITQYSIQKVNNGETLVTVSSPKPLNSNVFKGVFKNGGVKVLKHYWKAAYPIFKPVNKIPQTHIDKRFIYLSAVEPSVSSMETSALSALNAVRILSKEY